MSETGSLSETGRLFRLATETYADRGGLAATGSADAVVRCLIKTQTQLSKVDAKAFLAQADEILEQSTGSQQHGHPETYLRAKAVALYDAHGVETEDRIHAMLEGQLELDSLDLIRRRELSELTRELVDHLLQPDWYRTTATLAHARLLFDDYEPRAPQREPAALVAAIERYGTTVLDYLCYLLVDFVVVDPDLDELPLARAQTLAEQIGLLERFERHVNRELKVTKKVIASVRARRGELMEAAEHAPAGEPGS